MNPSTLYLVQSTYHNTPNIIDELGHLYQAGDQIIFMGDSVARLSTQIIQQFKSVSCLSIEKDLICNHPEFGTLSELADSQGVDVWQWILAGGEGVQPWDKKGFKIPGGAGQTSPAAAAGATGSVAASVRA